MSERDYFERFAGVEPSPEIVIQTDDDMQAFNAMFHAKWANDHKEVIREWDSLQMKECDYCGKTGKNLVEYDGRLMHEECARDAARCDAFWGGWG